MDFHSPPSSPTWLVSVVNVDGFRPCPPYQSAVTGELTKWVWLGLKTVVIATPEGIIFN